MRCHIFRSSIAAINVLFGIQYKVGWIPRSRKFKMQESQDYRAIIEINVVARNGNFYWKPTLVIYGSVSHVIFHDTSICSFSCFMKQQTKIFVWIKNFKIAEQEKQAKKIFLYEETFIFLCRTWIFNPYSSPKHTVYKKITPLKRRLHFLAENYILLEEMKHLQKLIIQPNSAFE